MQSEDANWLTKVPMGRRKFLGGALGLLAAAAVGSRARGATLFPSDTFESMTELGAPVSEYGKRSKYETAVRYLAGTTTPHASVSYSPLHEFHGMITPSALHFERHHAGVPDIDPQHWRLMIHGMVERSKVYDLHTIKRFPSVSDIQFIECAGNSQVGWSPDVDPSRTVQDMHGLISSSEWTGVPLSTLLREVGVKPGAKWLLAEGADGAAYSRSIPLEKAWDDVLVAYGQNGEALRPEQGYPVRLIVPGWEGSTMVKWLRRIEISDKPFMTRDETARYTEPLPNGKIAQFTWVMEAKSIITWPSGGQTVPEPGFWEVSGLAWSGRGPITRVEVSVDGGRNWQLAQLSQPALPGALVRFRFPWRWEGGEAVLQSRAMDATGYVQPSRNALLGKWGNLALFHYNGIQSWHVARDGRVTNVDA